MGQSTSKQKKSSAVQDPAVEVEYSPSAKFWIDGAYKQSDDDREIAQAKEVVPWLTDAIINAHRNPNIKHAAVQLLLVYEFTNNLGFLECWDPLRTGLIAQLTTLGAQLHDRYTEMDLGNVLSDKRVGCDKVKYHSLLPNKQQHDHTVPLTHADLLPQINDHFDLSGDHPEAMDERALLVVILMISQAANVMFQQKTRATLRKCKNVVLRGAPTKQYARALNKASSDHLGKSQPRTAYNIDTVRALLMVSDPTTMIKAFRLLVKGFDGVAKVKNLFVLPENERAERYHLLTLMATVIVDSGMTFGEMAKNRKCQQLFDAFAADVPHAEPKERWKRLCKRARDYLSHPSIANEKVCTYGEIQIILKPDAVVRQTMHLVYKVVRAETPDQLYDDFFQSYGQRPAEVENNTVYEAAYDGQLSVAAALLDGDANVDVGHSDGTTPLNIAAQRNHPDVLQLLIDRGAAVNKPKSDGSTSLFSAAQRNLLDVTKMLISNNAAMDQTGNDADTPLYVASQNNHLEVVKFLISNNAAMDQTGNDGDTPLYAASENNHLEVVKFLISNNAAIEKATNVGATPLFIASFNNLEVVKFLISNNAALDQVDNNGRAPLNAAASTGNLEIVKVLVEAGADLNVKGKWGTPLKEAIDDGQVNVVEYLRQHDANVE